MNDFDNGFVQKQKEGRPMLEQTHWEPINKQCYTLVDDDYKVLAMVTTPYDADDGDENFIWDVQIEGEDFGCYVSLYMAKMAVQQAIADWDEKMAAAAAKPKKQTIRKKKVKKSAVRK